MLLVPPEHHIVLQPGDRLRSSSGGEAWWSAASHEEADAAMHEVAGAVTEQALPFFEATRSADGLYGYLSQVEWGSRHHLELARGACAAWLGEDVTARDHLQRATALYQEDNRDWCPQYRERALVLLDAISHGSHHALLRTWRSETVAVLKLDDLANSAPAT
jgi:hypothetical protein